MPSHARRPGTRTPSRQRAPRCLRRTCAVIIWAGVALPMLPAMAAAQLASTVPAPAMSSLPPFLQKAVQAGQVKVLRSFPTSKPGLTGYVVRHKGRAQVVFGEDGYLFVGQVFSPRGDELSRRYGNEFLPKPNVASTVDKLERAGHLVVEGPADAPVLYVFADPNCIYCHRLYKMAEPLVKAGRLQLRWALVGFLKPSSPGRAAAILAAQDPVKALHANESHFDVTAEEGGLAPDKSPAATLLRLLQRHGNEMRAVGGTGTPTLIYRTGPKNWAIRVGLPPAAWLTGYAASGSPVADQGH